jgi:hypothetical protein
MSRNDNQFNFACPQCGQGDELDIAATVYVRLVADGTDADASHDGSHHWQDDSEAQCLACGWSGTVLNLDPDTFFTLQLGLGSNVAPHEGGSGPDEPVWYFDLKEQFDRAVQIAKEFNLPHNTGQVRELPPDELASDADEFRAYASLENEQANEGGAQ